MALPEFSEDIQRIIFLSLPPKAFARSSVLSKSWLSFYNSTRCSFDFSLLYNTDRNPNELWGEIIERMISHKTDPDPVPEELSQELSQKVTNFDKHLSASLLREKLTVEEFNINIHMISYPFRHGLADPIYKWLAALFTTNNVVKVLRIQLRTWVSDNLYLPPEILSNESLQVLRLENCIFDRVRPRNLGCLRVLSLFYVSIDGKSTNRLLAACPILEQLTLWINYEEHFITIKGLHKLTDLHLHGFTDVRIQEAPALQNVILNNLDYRTIINSLLCRRIRDMVMDVNSLRTATHIQRIVSCLPELEKLKLSIFGDTERIRISSPCLQNLILLPCNGGLMVKINAPNLRYYEYDSESVSRHLMINTGMLEMVVIILDISQMYFVESELWDVLGMIEQLKFGVDTIEYIRDSNKVRTQASRLNGKLNVPPGSVKLDEFLLKYHFR